jgi:hypothetical protein
VSPSTQPRPPVLKPALFAFDSPFEITPSQSRSSQLFSVHVQAASQQPGWIVYIQVYYRIALFIHTGFPTGFSESLQVLFLALSTDFTTGFSESLQVVLLVPSTGFSGLLGFRYLYLVSGEYPVFTTDFSLYHCISLLISLRFLCWYHWVAVGFTPAFTNQFHLWFHWLSLQVSLLPLNQTWTLFVSFKPTSRCRLQPSLAPPLEAGFVRLVQANLNRLA